MALVAAMHRDLVERDRLFTDEQYNQGITLAQLSPGPLAAQLCFYLGYVQGGFRGAAACAAAFILPSFLMVLAIGWAYARHGASPAIRLVFYFVGAAVTGIIARAAWRLLKRTTGSDWLLGGTAATLAVATILTGREPVLLILAAGLILWIVRAPPRWLSRSRVNEAASLLLLIQIVAFFTYAGAFVFGSGLAIVPFLHGGLVVERHWLTEAQFIDGVAVALITPGPVVITSGFIGYLVAGVAGAVAAAGATFLPCFAITVLLAPHVERYGRSPALVAIASGVTAGAMGALAGAVVLIGVQTVRDVPTAAIAAAAAGWPFARRVLTRPPGSPTVVRSDSSLSLERTMGKINLGKVVVGGLLAGVVLNVFDYVLHGVVLVDDWAAAMTALGKTPNMDAAIPYYVTFDFILGILLVKLYAMIRPRFGGGVKTAVIAGVMGWSLVCLIPTLFQYPGGLLPMNLLVMPLVVALVSQPLATVAGAWLYKE